MNKKTRHKSSKAASAGQLPWLSLVAGGAILLIIVGLAIWWASAGSSPAAAPQTSGGTPRLAVDRTTIDDGYVKFETPIQAAFNVRNNGTQPLQVELIEGC